MYLPSVVLAVLDFTIFARSDDCIQATLTRKTYAIVQTQFYFVNATYLCSNLNTECSAEGLLLQRMRGMYNQNKHKYEYSIPIKEGFVLSTPSSTLNFVSREAKKYFRTDSLTLPTDVTCKFSEKYCYDFKINDYVIWNRTRCLTPNFITLYIKEIEEWTVRQDRPVVKFLAFTFDNRSIVLQLIRRKRICNQLVWTTDMDDVYAYEVESTVSVYYEKDALLHYVQPINGDIVFCEDSTKSESYMPLKIDPSDAKENATSDEEDPVRSSYGITYFLAVFSACVMCLAMAKFVCGIIVNCVILKRADRGISVGEISVRCFSQNLTYQRMITRKTNGDENTIYAQNKNLNDGIYENNDFYNDI